MLLKPYRVETIVREEKTATRRKWKRQMVKVGGTYQAQTKLYHPETVFAHIQVAA